MNLIKVKISKTLIVISFLILLFLPFQNCAPNKLSSLNSSYGGGEPYQGNTLIDKRFVVNSNKCPDGLEAFAITKIDKEANFILVRNNCADTNILLEPQLIEWVVEGVSFIYQNQLYEFKKPY